jgi:hypothetical protein
VRSRPPVAKEIDDEMLDMLAALLVSGGGAPPTAWRRAAALIVVAELDRIDHVHE